MTAEDHHEPSDETGLALVSRHEFLRRIDDFGGVVAQVVDDCAVGELALSRVQPASEDEQTGLVADHRVAAPA